MTLPNGWNSAAQATVAPPSVMTERYIPIFWNSNGPYSMQGSQMSTATVDKYISKTSSSTPTAGTTAAATLYTCPSNANPNTLYALEASMYNNVGSSCAANVELYDLTASAWVTGSLVSTTANNAVTNISIARSGTFTLTPGHKYAACLWLSGSSSSTNYAYLCDLSLVQFP